MDFDVQRVLAAISAERLRPFLAAASDSVEHALKLYLWDIEISAAFHLPLHATEVALRNHLATALVASFGPEWWTSRRFAQVAGPHEMASIRRATAGALRPGEPLAASNLIAQLSLGFWVSLLDGRYGQTLWINGVAPVFQGSPDVPERNEIEAAAQAIRTLRNRISHHEPIFSRDLSGDFGRLMQFLGWLSPAKARWIKPHCRIPALLRQKP